MTLSVYVAASSAEIDRARRAIAMLRDDGIEVTSTWPEVITAESNGCANPRDASLAERFRWASTDLRQVYAADVLWMLAPESANGRGAYEERGYARALGKLTITSGDTLQSIFGALSHEFATDEEAFAFLQHLARRR